MALYLTIKALHVVAIIVWIGGMLAVSLLLTSMQPASGPFLLPENRLLAAAYHWDRRVTTSAMVLAWALGLIMSMLGHWFAAAWFSTKLVVVLGLSALHGIQAGTLRRLVTNGLRRKPSGALRFTTIGIIISITAVIALVILKPF